MKDLEKLAKKFGEQISDELPADAKFILFLAKKEGGKCATNMKDPQRYNYLRKCAESLSDNGGGIIFIEITTK